MNIEDSFAKTVDHFGLEWGVGRMLAYAHEDKHPGNGHDMYSNSVAINREEGRYLYALIRQLRPQRVLEIGCADGVSAIHILAALEANGEGELVSVDLNENAGQMIPQSLRSRWKFIHGDAFKVKLPTCDLLFEDGAHTYDSTLDALKLRGKLKFKAALVHDVYLHWGVRKAFDDGFDGAGIKFLFDGTNTGLGVWLDTNK